MKNFLIIVFILSIILSCKTTKNTIVENERILIKDSLLINDTIIIADSDGDGILDQIDFCPNEYGLDSNGCPILSKLVIEINEIQNNDKNNNDKSNSESLVISKIKKHESKTKSKVIDYSTKDTTKGWIAYSVPKEMQVSKSYSIKVRISKKTNQNKATLVIGDGYSINNPNLPSIVSIEDIKVSGEMTPELISEPDAFKINLLSTPTQNIDNESYTEWEWNVTPLKSGNTTLKLIIKIKEINKDIIVFNRNISVKSNVPVVVKGFFEKYWQWIMSTFIIPIFLFFWNRKKKAKRKS